MFVFSKMIEKHLSVFACIKNALSLVVLRFSFKMASYQNAPNQLVSGRMIKHQLAYFIEILNFIRSGSALFPQKFQSWVDLQLGRTRTTKVEGYLHLCEYALRQLNLF